METVVFFMFLLFPWPPGKTVPPFVMLTLLSEQLIDSVQRLFVEIIASGNLQLGMQQFRSQVFDRQGHSPTKARLPIGFYRRDDVISSVILALDSEGGLLVVEHTGKTYQTDRTRTYLR